MRIPAIALVAALLAGAAAAGPAPAPTLHQAADLVEWGRWKEARALLAGGLNATATTQDAPLEAFYGHVLVAFGDLRDAEIWVNRALAADDRCAPCHLYHSEVMGEQARKMSETRALFQIPKIKKELDRASTLDPNVSDVQWGWVRLNLDLPAVAGGSLADAYHHADLLAALDPVDGELARASIAEAIGQKDRALEFYRAAAAARADDPRGIFALGRALYDRGDYAGAQAPLTHAQSLNGESALYNGYLAAEFIRLRQPDRGRALLDAAAKRFPDSRAGDFLVAQALIAQSQDLPWARDLLRRYLEVETEPEQPTSNQARDLERIVGS